MIKMTPKNGKYSRVENVIIVGTSHISQESVENVAAVIKEFSPCVVGVELDRQRFHALISDNKNIRSFSFENVRRFGLKGYIFAIIAGAVTERLAKLVNTKPGDDMRSAIKTAKKYNLTVALLDQPIDITLRRFSKELMWKEKWHFFVDIVNGILFPKRQFEKYGINTFDLRKVPANDIVKKLLRHVRTRYPKIYTVLITERNEYMARKIIKFVKKYPEMPVVAVVGAGHEDGILKLLENNKI